MHCDMGFYHNCWTVLNKTQKSKIKIMLFGFDRLEKEVKI